MSSVATTDIILSNLCYSRLQMHAFILGLICSLRLPLVRFWSKRKQTVGQPGVVLTSDWSNIQHDRIGAVFGGAHHNSSAQWVVPHGILAESKTVLSESDLILRTRIFF
jgi:hypothetical protein